MVFFHDEQAKDGLKDKFGGALESGFVRVLEIEDGFYPAKWASGRNSYNDNDVCIWGTIAHVKFSSGFISFFSFF